MVNRINGVISVSLQCMFVFCAVLLHTLLCSGPCVCIFYIYRRLSALADVACFFNLLLLCSIICNGGMRKSFSVFRVMPIYTCTAAVKNNGVMGMFQFSPTQMGSPTEYHFQFWPCVQQGCNGEAYPHRI